MALEDYGPYNPTGYDPKKPRPMPPPADVPRGGQPVPLHAPLSDRPLFPGDERDNVPETYADPLSATRGMRYGLGDERDLSVPVIDPRDPLAPSPATWTGVVPRGSGRAAYSTNGGYAYTDAPAVPDQSTPRPLFSGVAGEDFEATRRRGEQVAKLMRETDGPFANPNDWNYVRSYGPRAAAQAVASGRANISGAPAELVAQERERFLRNRTTDLSISPQLRSAARDELAQIERDAAEERRREMWAEEQAARLRMAEGANAATVEAARLTAQGQEAAAKAKADAEAAASAAKAEAAAAAARAEATRPQALANGGALVAEVDEGGAPTGYWNFVGGNAGGSSPKSSAVRLRPGDSYFDPETGSVFVAPGADAASIDKEIASLTAALGKAFDQTVIAELRKQLDDARARRAALGATAPQGTPAPASPAPGGASSPSEPPAPAPAPTPAPAPAAAPAPSVAPGGRVPVQTGTAPAPAAPAAPEPKPAPKGYKRLPNGELEYVG